ncbi:hypothetical protein A0257_13935 [Hymenobacter psoromatis]|nr:hypothetical protein A0257_13935 [Hymenobacter psoromatis]
MKTLDPADLKGLFIRPASLVIRFGDEGLYKSAIRSYANLLDTDPSAPDAIGNYQYCSFQVGNPLNLIDRDIELRLEYRPKDALAGCTILFWRTKKGVNVDTVIQQLEKANYGRKRKDSDSSTHHLRGDDRCLLDSPDGEFVGGHTNPPFPPGGGRDSLTRKHRFAFPSSLLFGLLGGLALASLLPGALGLRRTGE